MGILYGLAKLGETGVDLYKGVRGEVEQSRFKSFVEENPDWADNPDKMTQAISISPTLGMSLVDRGKQVADQRSARASQRLLFMQKADEDAHKAYTQALEKGGDREAEGGGADVMGNYAAADRAGNDAYQRYRILAQDLYGEGFADKLPRVWKLSDPENPGNGYEGRRQSQERLLSTMEEQVDLVFPDGRKSTVSMLPHRLSKFIKENPGIRVQKIATSAPVKEGLVGGLDPKERADITGKVADDFVKDSDRFIKIGEQFRNIVSLSNDPTGPADLGVIYSYMKMLDPGSTVMQGEYATAENAGSIPANVRNAYNKMLGGEKISETRGQFIAAAEKLYKEHERAQDAREQGLTRIQQAYKLTDDEMGAIRGRVPRIEAAARRPPPQAQTDAPPTAPPPPAQQAAARETYQTFLKLARDPAAFQQAAPAAQEQAFRALKDDDLRTMSTDIEKLNEAQTTKLWEEYRRRGWLK